MATGGACVALVGTFVPWLRSGARAAQQLRDLLARSIGSGFSQSSVVGWGVRLWPVVPFLLVLAVVLLWFAPQWITATAVVVRRRAVRRRSVGRGQPRRVEFACSA